MEVQELTNLILNSTVSVVVIGFFMYRDIKFMGQLQLTLTTLVDTVAALKECVEDLEERRNGN